MKILLFATALLTFLNVANTQKHFVDSVNCTSSGISLTFSTDPNQSELYKNTKLNIRLYSGKKHVEVVDFEPGKPNARITYFEFDVEAVTVYGPNKRALLYKIEQPFLAVPEKGGNNYAFTVSCAIPASYHFNISNNTIDNADIPGDGGGDELDPKKQVKAEVEGLQNNAAALGQSLKFDISFNDDKSPYTALIPESCRYYNPNNEKEQLTFVSEKCPQRIEGELEDYFGTIKRINQKNYQLIFRAFAFDDSANSLLGIECEVTLCILNDTKACYKPCWDTSTTDEIISTTEAATTRETTDAATSTETQTTTETTQLLTTETSEAATSTEEPTTTTAPPTTIDVATTTQTSEPTSTAPETTEAPTTALKTTEATTELTTEPPTSSVFPTTVDATTEVLTSTTEASDPEGSTIIVRAERDNLEKHVDDKHKSNRNRRSAETAQNFGELRTVTVTENAIFRVQMPNEPSYDPCNPVPVPCNYDLLNALYGVVSGLSILFLFLVLTLVYLVCTGRRGKLNSEQAPVFVTSNPPLYYKATSQITTAAA